MKNIKFLNIPVTCPICGGKTAISKDNDSKVLICTNPSCKGKLLGRLSNFVSKAGMNIDGLSEETLRKFISLDLLENFSDIYNLKKHRDSLICLDGFGEKSIDKLLKNVESSRNVKLENFLYALGINGIGKSQSKVLSKEFHGDWFEFEKSLIDAFMFTKLEGFGSVLHFNIYEWYEKRFLQEKIDCLTIIMNFQTTEVKKSTGKDLSGLTFVITGSLEHFENRDAAKEEIERLGGKVSGSVSSKTNYLVNNDIGSMTGKNKKAKELGVEIITEDILMKMCR